MKMNVNMKKRQILLLAKIHILLPFYLILTRGPIIKSSHIICIFHFFLCGDDGIAASDSSQGGTQSMSIDQQAENTVSFDTFESLELEFAEVTDQIKQALSQSDVRVVSLVEQLSTMSAVKYKKVPLFDENIFEKLNTIEELWKILRNYWCIVDYDILRYVVHIAKCQEAKTIFDNFLSRIDSASLDGFDLVLACEKYEEESFRPLLRIKISEKKCTQAIQKKVKDIVSRKFDLENYVCLAF